jgi:hypothetical protein
MRTRGVAMSKSRVIARRQSANARDRTQVGFLQRTPRFVIEAARTRRRSDATPREGDAARRRCRANAMPRERDAARTRQCADATLRRFDAAQVRHRVNTTPREHDTA